ncbi:HisA/HisF-related TIM barrel protein [Herbaspirillum sp. NPDC101397]|uniref:HisA/HisF-related TIM barrel protein n=1 Tax=Herbaspirillum sp. NPDC101397 TaxID=3364006 RepID=UPI00383B48B6
MLKKRLIGVVTVKEGWAVQSFGYSRYLPLGRPECLVENLDRWGADEILVQCIDRSAHAKGPDFQLLEKLAQLGLGTPLIYGGGIRTVDDGVRVVQAGADRIAIDALLHDDRQVLSELGQQLGVQALIASIPVAMSANTLQWYDYRSKALGSIEALADIVEQKMVSEVLLIDYLHEGHAAGFDAVLADAFDFGELPLLLFGGISTPRQMQNFLAMPKVVAVAVGNFLSYRELAIQQFKNALERSTFRPPMYATEHSFLSND